MNEVAFSTIRHRVIEHIKFSDASYAVCEDQFVCRLNVMLNEYIATTAQECAKLCQNQDDAQKILEHFGLSPMKLYEYQAFLGPRTEGNSITFVAEDRFAALKIAQEEFQHDGLTGKWILVDKIA